MKLSIPGYAGDAGQVRGHYSAGTHDRAARRRRGLFVPGLRGCGVSYRCVPGGGRRQMYMKLSIEIRDERAFQTRDDILE